MRVLIAGRGRAMKSFFALTWAVCLSVCFVLIPSSAFAGVAAPVCEFGEIGVTVCRDAVDVACDVAETCSGTGVNAECPPDSFQPATTTCTGSSDGGACDGTDYCDGFGACVDGYLDATNECRPSAGVCDQAESCDGLSADCPTDGFVSGGECRASAGVCDVAESCDGGSADCPADGPNLTTECNASSGACDPAEFCSNSSDDCPVDVLDPVGTVCVASQGVCDEAETCTGTSALCPGDLTNDTTFECRPSAGACDVGEFCQEYSPNCPADVVKPIHTECRGTGGNECDVAEVCDGSTGVCPTDVFAGEGTLCGKAPDFACDAQEVCVGTSATCGANPDPLVACGVIGKGDGCELNMCDQSGPSDFKLLFTPDLPNWVAYKLNASNPGQLFYTLVSDTDVPDDANLLLQIPFPFVTQGNMPLHVFGAADVEVQNSCLVIDEGAGSKPYDVEITMDSYWGAGPTCTDPTNGAFPTEPGAYCKHVTGPNPENFVVKCPSDYDPNGGSLPPALALQECWAYVPVELTTMGNSRPACTSTTG